MAISIFDSTFGGTWKEELLGPLASKAFQESSLAGAGATLIESRNGDFVFPEIDVDSDLAPFEECPTTLGSVSLTQRTQSLCAMALNWEATHDSLLNSFFGINYRAGVQTKRLPDNELVLRNIIDTMIAKFFEGANTLIVNGGGYTGFSVTCPNLGLIPKMDASAATEKVAAIDNTPNNVLTSIEVLYKALPIAVKRATGIRKPKLFLSQATTEAVMDRFFNPQQVSGTGPSSAPFGGIDFTSGLPTRLYGYEFYTLEALPDNVAFATAPANIIVGMDGRQDMLDLQVRDLFDSTLCRKYQAQLAARMDATLQRFDQAAIAI
jgi:hypothetical protein